MFTAYQVIEFALWVYDNLHHRREGWVLKSEWLTGEAKPIEYYFDKFCKEKGYSE